jgi:hypothetical protein
MKSYIIISIAALFSGALASDGPNAHGLEDLVARGIDPKTVDPTRLSVLSVLRTAIPSGPDFAQPTSDFEPEWYRKLPEDVKSLLPSLYPVTSTEVSSGATVSVPVSASTTEMVSCAPALTSPLILGKTYLTTNQSLIVSYQINTVVPSVAVSNTTFPPSRASQPTTAKALQNVPSTITGSGMAPNDSSALSNGTLVIATQTAPAPFTGGAETATRVEKLAALAWVGIAAGFVFFA